MGFKPRLIPLLEIDLGTRKLYYSSQAIKIRDGDNVRQYEGKLISEGGVARSFSLSDFKTSLTVASNVNVGNADRLQDIFADNPESFTGIKLMYLNAEDMTAKIEELSGIASNPSWDDKQFNMQVKDSQKLYFKEVPFTIFDEKTFQTSLILSDATVYTRTAVLGNPQGTAGSTRNVTLVSSIRSSSFGERPVNFWKGARIDVIMDQRLSDHTDNASGHFAVVIKSSLSEVFFNYEPDNFLMKDNEISSQIINNTMEIGTIDVATVETYKPYLPETLTFQIVRNAVPQGADSVGNPVPILYGAPEKVPMVWAVGQKSTNTNSFGCGDDVYLFSSHKSKLRMLHDSNATSGVTATSANNGVYSYSSDDVLTPQKDQLEISDGLRAEVYWSLEDKRVVDIKIAPGNKNWIPNPFPKRWKNSVDIKGNYAYRDQKIRLVSPLHRIKVMTTLRGETVHAVQLRGGEFDWFEDPATGTPFNVRGQYPIRYGMGNSKLYISTEGFEDDLDGFYTGHIKSQLYGGGTSTGENIENAKQSTLIKNPADIMLHFLMNYTAIDQDRNLIDIDSFRKCRQQLDGWRFDTAITEFISGEQLIDRWCQQCCSIMFMDRGKFRMKTILPNKLVPKLYLRENEHALDLKLEFTKTEDIFNNFIFSYKYDYVHQKYAGVFKRNRTNDPKCQRSFAVNGFERSKNNIELRDIADEVTAHKLADAYVDYYSSRRVFVDCKIIYTQEVIDANLEIGDCVTLTTTKAPNGWTEKSCVVLDTRKYADRMEVRLMEV